MLLVVLITLAACGGASPQAEVATTAADAGSLVPRGFDRLVMLENVTQQLILPNHEALVQALQALETAAVAFVDAPDPARLDAVQDAWLAANLARMALLPYRLGPVDDSLLHNRLDNRPPRTAFIDDEILAGDAPIDAAYIDSIGSSSVGLGAMEYLLFDPAGGDAAVLATFTGATMRTGGANCWRLWLRRRRRRPKRCGASGRPTAITTPRPSSMPTWTRASTKGQ